MGLITLTSQLQAQDIIKFKTTEIAYKYTDSNDRWEEWSEWKDAKVLIILDTNKERIKIYSKETQIYDIAEDEGKKTNENGEDIYSLFCVNEDGSQCRLKLWKRYYKSGNIYYQLYINFSDAKYVYNMDILK
ncbi:hypothetical protein [Polaribacter butkevichii]|nr:hypothetical protein [Polaribacter butkevichii]